MSSLQISKLAKRVFFSLGCCSQIFEFFASYEELISEYQHLNKRFYKTILPQLRSTVTLYHQPWTKFSGILQNDTELTVIRKFKNEKQSFTKDFQAGHCNVIITDFCQIGLHTIAVLMKNGLTTGTLKNVLKLWNTETNNIE